MATAGPINLFNSFSFDTAACHPSSLLHHDVDPLDDEDAALFVSPLSSPRASPAPLHHPAPEQPPLPPLRQREQQRQRQRHQQRPSQRHCSVADLSTRFDAHSISPSSISSSASSADSDLTSTISTRPRPTPPSDQEGSPATSPSTRSSSLSTPVDADPSSSYFLRHFVSSSNLRLQRQRAIRRQTSSSHLRDIRELVARMVSRGEQCSRSCSLGAGSNSSSPTSAALSPSTHHHAFAMEPASLIPSPSNEYDADEMDIEEMDVERPDNDTSATATAQHATSNGRTPNTPFRHNTDADRSAKRHVSKDVKVTKHKKR